MTTQSTSTDQTSIVTTGLNGLVGSTFKDMFGSDYQITSLDISDPNSPTDITKLDQVLAATQSAHPKYVLHFAAFTDVTRAWEETDNKSGLTYQVNVEGTRNMVAACEAENAHLIHISTAYVFDGQKETEYLESDPTNPIEWYGQTKAWAEEVVQSATCPWTILRIDFPFRNKPFPKPDIARKNIASMEKGYPLFNDHFFGPTSIEDFSKVLDWVIRSKTTGLFHASSGEKWSDFELGQALIKAHNLPYKLEAGSLDEYLKTSNRPYHRNTAMNVDRLKKAIDFSLTPIDQALKNIQL